MKSAVAAPRLLLASLVVALFVGCNSGGEAPAPPRISSAVAERDVVDGVAQLTSTVKVSFDRNFELADSRVPFASHFEFDVPLAEGGSERALVQTAEHSVQNSRLVTLKVGRLIPEGATLKISRKAFDPKAVGTLEIEVTGELDATLVLLASEALIVTNPDFFNPATLAELTDADRDPAIQREALEAHMNQRLADPDTLEAALLIYDSIPESVVPSPKLRAALAGLTGTFAEPAIGSLLTRDNCTGQIVARIAFEPPPGNPELIARVTYVGDGARVVSINPFAEGERIEHLMPILAHEAIHCDNLDSRAEEIAATAFDGFLYLQLIAADPELASVQTRVARELNIDAVAMFNSGALIPESIGILPSIGVTQVLPGTNASASSFAEFVAAAYPTVTNSFSPTEPLAQQYAAILAEVSGTPSGDAFDLRYLDELLSRSTGAIVLATAIGAFGLSPEG